MDSLGIGGGERSLVTLLSLIDYTKYHVDLQLFALGGQFEQLLPKQVNILPLLEYSKFLQKNIMQQFLTFDFKKLLARWKYSLELRKRTKLSHSLRTHLQWQSMKGCISIPEKTYDVAIAYSQGVPTMYVADKVRAKRKASWINTMYGLETWSRGFMSKYYSKIDVINAVSQEALRAFESTMPECKDKMVVIKDIISQDLVERLSQMPINYMLDEEVSIIVTVSRLNKGMKGLDITMDVAKILHEHGVKFHWYVLGKGPYETKMRQYISTNHLEGCFTLLGAVANPYPYMRKATLYVQTSRSEGYGLSIAEARMLNIPVVTTAYEGVYMQMIPNKNGVVVPIDATQVAAAIEDLLKNPKKRKAISQYQKTEKKGNIEEIQKFYELIVEGIPS